jgi:crossover junction endodeoxyribonuclease RusA
MGFVIAITLPWPPSVNTYWRHPSKGALAGRTLVSEKGRAYRDAVQKLAQSEKWGGMGDARLSVQIDAYMPDKRRRDIDNVLKAALDSLTAAGVWDDDSQIDHLSIRRASTIGGMLKVRITEVIA